MVAMGPAPWQTFPMRVLSREHAERAHAVRSGDESQWEATPVKPGGPTWFGTDAQLYHRTSERLTFMGSTKLRFYDTAHVGSNDRADFWQSADEIRLCMPDVVHIYR